MVRAFHEHGIKVLDRRRLQPHRRGRRRLAAVAARARQRGLLPARSRRHRVHELERRRRRPRDGIEAARRRPDDRLARVLARRRSASTASASTSRRCSATSAGPAASRSMPTFPACSPSASHARATVRDGVDLIAEPWGIGRRHYQVGNFPAGWSEWNDEYRDLIRDDQNRRGVAAVTPGWLAARVLGSSELFRDDGRAPSASHQLPRLARRLHAARPLRVQRQEQRPGVAVRSVRRRQRRQPAPGTTAATPVAQRQAARTGLALLACSRRACR